ncbi:NosL [Roseovarius litorisediminis]|uniref:NosL n=1 Tax=Roseovarius litorisediminis TaxID=1312363 RepID=A0A1Y5SPX6_9RHOB|nr:nitrous oxide reductase accessory protein NosL [Roseovarius litorisediminis]SLN44432.1 NosL [Roseovarius litorisediminis]
MNRLFLTTAFLLAACQIDEAKAPDPVTLTADALGHFCMMQVDAHPGPKAQIHLAGLPEPIFFTQVRDALAYVKGSERDADILAFYVSDMGVPGSWENLGPDNWVPAPAAHFVVGSDVRGGMGAPEIVPFADAQVASDFAVRKGGEVMTLDTIPAEIVLSPVEIDLDKETQS